MLRVKWRIGLLFIACITISSMSFNSGLPFASLNPTWAQEQRRQIYGTREGVTVRCEMYLMGKTKEGVIISEVVFRILPSTVILNTEGKKITLWELRVPSIAFVEYSMKTDNSTPTIVNLQLKSGPQKR